MKDFCLENKKNFLSAHHNHAKAKLAPVAHVLIYLNGRLSLLQKKGPGSKYCEIQSQVTPAEEAAYLSLKTISHSAVWLHILLDDFCQGNSSKALIIQETQSLKESLMVFKKAYHQELTSLAPAIEHTLTCIDQISNCLDVYQLKEHYQNYMKSMKPHLELMAHQASELQLNGLHAIMSDYLKQIDLRQTYIIIVGPRGPREGLIEHQYFARLRKNHGLESNTSSGGLIYSEMLPCQMRDVAFSTLIDDLAGYLLNQNIGEQMLDDINAMNKDILGKFASHVLDALDTKQTQVPRSWNPNFWQEKPRNSSGRCPLHESQHSTQGVRS